MSVVEATEHFTVEEIERRLQLDDIFTEQITPSVLSYLMRQSRAAQIVANDGLTNLAAFHAAVLGVAENVELVLSSHLYRTALAGAVSAFEQLGIKAETTFRNEMLDWARRRAAELVVQVSETTMNIIRDAVTAALEAREGQPRLAAVIRWYVEGMGQLSVRARAQAIARTETHNASVYGADQSAQRSGVDYMRTWLSAEDARTRADHAAAHGQQRGPNESFLIGGFAMMRPGQGPAAQVINCRCVVGYRPVNYVKSRISCA